MSDSNGKFESGLAMRKQVLGDEHVQRSLDRASEFTRPIQELATGYCWGEIWTRDGLGLRERSLINLGMLTALNRSHELAVHVRGAVRNGCTRKEIQETLLQAAVYCGMPAGLEAFRVADQTLDALDREAANGGDGSIAERDGEVSADEGK
jgi:4-carboxymuconolactone decarboxylase